MDRRERDRKTQKCRNGGDRKSKVENDKERKRDGQWEDSYRHRHRCAEVAETETKIKADKESDKGYGQK